MATSTVDRAYAKAAAALLPGLLPTPPTSTMVAPCIVILPADFYASNPKSGRADSVQRWDAYKIAKIKSCSPAPSNGGNALCAGRADSVERWDAHKTGKSPGSLASSQGRNTLSPGRADSVQRWDAHKNDKKLICKGSLVDASSCKRWGTNSSSSSSWLPDRTSSCVKRPPSSASSADRWETHKKPRSAQQTDAGNDEGRTGEHEIVETPKDETMMEMDATVARAGHVFSGPSYYVSPEPSVLPLPAFFASPEPAMLPVPAFLMAH